MTEAFYTPPEVAARLRCKPDRVRAWILKGELEASNIGDGSRPRFRVSQSALDAFLKSRSGARPAPEPQRRRRAAAVCDGPY
jgi:excisionase family DNA binding protein